VRGSRVTFDGKPAIIAATVRKGDEELALRDAAGRPVWSGWRRRQLGRAHLGIVTADRGLLR
jgi:hypothetical protein